MNIYKSRKLYLFLNLLIMILPYIVFLQIIPKEYYFSSSLVYIIGIPLVAQYLYTSKIIIDSNAFKIQFWILKSQYHRTFLWTDIGSVKYRFNKVYLYDKDNRKIFILGKHLTNHTKLYMEINEHIRNHIKDSILDESFTSFINDLNKK